MVVRSHGPQCQTRLTASRPFTTQKPFQHRNNTHLRHRQPSNPSNISCATPSHGLHFLDPRFPVPSSTTHPFQTLQQVSHTSVPFKVPHQRRLAPTLRSFLLSACHVPVAARTWRCLRVLDVSQAKTETATLWHGWLLCRSTLAPVLTEVVIVLPASRCGRHGQPMLEKDIRQR